jgi:hypothetical protein
MLAPGETKQLFAVATRTDGTTIDVTNLATWQSSNPVVATVGPSGLLSAAAEGTVDIMATYSNVRGTLRAEIKRPNCDVTVSPQSASYTAFGGSASVTVAVSPSSCGWSARSDAPWFVFTYDPGRPGDGAFTYSLPPNSTSSPRSANIVIEAFTGQQAVHAITEDKPLGCSYVTDPAEATFTAAGGSGQFRVITTPGDCRWNVVNGMSQLGVVVTSGWSGTGGGLVRYSVQANTRTTDSDGYIEIAGLSGLNPNGRHHIVIQRR